MPSAFKVMFAISDSWAFIKAVKFLSYDFTLTYPFVLSGYANTVILGSEDTATIPKLLLVMMLE